MLKFLLLAFTAMSLLASPLSASQAPLWGYTHAKDADSLLIDGKSVRLFGIDAPELDQSCRRGNQTWACGSEASAELAQLVAGKPLLCLPTGIDQYQRILARCTAGGTDIHRTMVERGYAVAYRHYSLDYVAAEEAAKAAKRGLWAGEFELPSDYRHGKTGRRPFPNARSPKILQGRATQRRAGSCNIKGNRNRRSEWIYHVLGMPYYDLTRPEEVPCTEQQAQAAGYRRAIVR